MSITFREAVLAMAEARPNARVSTIVALALACEFAKPPSLDDAFGFGTWAARQPEVAPYLKERKKVHAVKELRALSGASLLQAKNAIDAVWGVTA